MPRPRSTTRPRRSRSVAPASTVADLTIGEIGVRGDGIGCWEGQRLFVPATVAGDRVRVRLGATRGDGRAAELLELLSAGPGRTEPVCPHFGTCGGCSLQHLAPALCEDWKRGRVLQALARAGVAAPAELPLQTVPPASRRRVSFTIAAEAGRLSAGFSARQSHRLVDIESCAVLEPALVALLPLLRQWLPAVLGRHGCLEAVAQRLDGGVDLLLCGPPRLDLAAREALAALAEAADLARLSWQPAAGAPVEPLAARRPAGVRFGPVMVEPPPGAFLQACAAAESALVAAVLEAVGPAERVADLYSGCGTFALPLAAGRARVHAVEGDAAALAALVRAARPLPQLSAERRNLEREPLSPAELAGFAAVVFDPPRAGAAPQAAALAAGTVPVVVAVSCNPASFARDARTLCDGGYRLDTVRLVDQFRWSAHVELVACFRRLRP